MKIGGFQEFSLIDYPGKLCAIVFTQGCNFRCPYCHNPELVDPERFTKPVSEDYIFSFLEKRKDKLDAVEITGGEPTLHRDLADFIAKIKSMGFLIKLDSNGTNPEVVETLIKNNMVDYLAMDVKAPLEKYGQAVGAEVDTKKIKKSIELIKRSGLEHEFRTTIVRGHLSPEDIVQIGKLLEGASLYILQKFVPSKTLDPEFSQKETYSKEEFIELRDKIKKYVKECMIR